ncbi:hypothetical protein DZC30_08715 [Comamonas testosteroni]|uniref:Uncharacterized protein n=1 Tax=Comamonas testosteroni TaxID=285 RepID=A0A373FQ62_COMTE|nr:hypothetical protein [Comamonas testosteroni]RGE45645.1 hypothetical protein DZC30_08715 [Comamonas testosteroni]
MLIIQVVEILWTKATRGAPRANERVALPRAFPFSAGDQPCVIQRYQMAEWKDFAPLLLEQKEQQTIPGSVDALQIIALGNDSYSLGIHGTPHDGQPRRHPVLRAITLNAGESARILINARHTSYSGQHYSETIYNVACGEQLPADLFLRAPNQLLDLKAHLF